MYKMILDGQPDETSDLDQQARFLWRLAGEADALRQLVDHFPRETAGQKALLDVAGKRLSSAVDLLQLEAAYLERWLSRR